VAEEDLEPFPFGFLYGIACQVDFWEAFWKANLGEKLPYGRMGGWCNR